MSEINLSSAVRGNLLSLQNTAKLLERTQQRLATGLKVNSALDDPTAFFTSASLNNRAADLTRLLDSTSLGVQTLKAADVGIKAITDLLETAQASARQALQAPGPLTPNVAATVTGTSASVAADAAAVATGSVTTIAADVAATSASSGTTIVGSDLLSSANLGSIAATDTLTVTSSDASFSNVSITFAAGTGTTASAFGVGLTATDLVSQINTQAGSAIASITGGNISITSPTGDITIGGTNAAAGINLASSVVTNSTLGGITSGDALTFTTSAGTSTATFGASVNTRAEVLAALNGGASGATFAFTGNTLVATQPNATAGNVTITGGASALSAVGFTASQVAETTNSTLGAITQGQTLTIDIGGSTQTVTFGSGSTEVNTKAELDTRLAAIQTAFSGTAVVSADVNGNLTVTAGNTTGSITLGGTAPLTTFGTNLTTTATDPVPGSTSVNNIIRAKAETDYNALLIQITQLARDASFNGNNLLQNDNLTIFFNENSTSSLTINGVDFDANGLGLTAQAAGSFQDNTNINSTLSGLESAILQIRTQSGTFGSNLSVVETRQQFTSSLIKTLETGGANLVLADTNQEGANLLALQTRQQLSSTALSLASQADQNVLRLFR